MSSTRASKSRWSTVLYGAAIALAIAEGVVFWQALHPRVTENYRAYYIAQTSTCLDQPKPGTYDFATLLPFRSGFEREIAPIRVCGWDGPAGNGLHSVGESSMLRFSIPDGETGLVLWLELAAIDRATGGMPVVVSTNGVTAARLETRPGDGDLFRVPVPKAAERDGMLHVVLAYPEALLMSPLDAATRKRAIRLTAAGVESETAKF